jgi:limonene-1,2-epoxide hydrolase
MSDENMAGVMRSFVQAMAAGDSAKAVSYVTDDAVYITPMGTFRGKTAIRGSIEGMARNMQNMAVKECGNGIIAQGNKAFFEHMLSGTFQGNNFEFLAMCAYEFDGDKIKNMRSTYDRLTVAQQSVKSWPASSFINMIAKQTQKTVK